MNLVIDTVRVEAPASVIWGGDIETGGRADGPVTEMSTQFIPPQLKGFDVGFSLREITA